MSLKRLAQGRSELRSWTVSPLPFFIDQLFDWKPTRISGLFSCRQCSN